MKTIRKLNGVLVLATQEPADAARSAISATLIQSAETQLFFGNPAADEDSYLRAFKLSAEEFETVRSMVPEHRDLLVKQSAGSVVVNVGLPDREALRVFSGTAESVRRLDAVMARYGERWLEPFLEEERAA